MTLRVFYRGYWLTLIDPEFADTRYGYALQDETQLCPLKDVARCELVKPQLKMKLVAV